MLLVTAPAPLLAEAVSIDGGTLVFILVIALAVLALAVGVAVLGCVLAYRAGRGSSNAMVGLIIIGVLEAFSLLSATGNLLRGDVNVFSTLALIPIAAQVGLYFLGRSRRPAASHPGAFVPPPPPPPPTGWR